MIIIIGINFRQDVIQQDIILYLPTYYYDTLILLSRMNCIGITYINHSLKKCLYQQHISN